MKKLILISLLLAVSFIVSAQQQKLYRLAFDTEQQAIEVQTQLQWNDSLQTGYKALDIRGKQGAVIKDAYTDDDGTEHDAVIDNRYFATVITKEYVNEVLPYVVDVPYFPMRYGGESEMEIIKPK